MATYRTVQRLAPEVAAYVAGLVDGEGTITLSALHRYSGRHAPSFAYRLTNRQALDLLSQIACHLKTYRATRADMAIRRYLALTPRNGKYLPVMLRLRNEFEQQFLAVGPGPRGRNRGIGLTRVWDTSYTPRRRRPIRRSANRVRRWLRNRSDYKNMDRSAHMRGPDARLNIAWWLDQLAGAPDVPALMTVANLFARAWPADKVEAMPVNCRPGRLNTPDDVANFAYTLARAQLSGNANTHDVHAMAMFFTEASTRLSRMLGLPQLDAASSRLFLNN